jgi:2-polyprenyl-3-methyl-5-hydroxy-6-metoxy-1,4-benzoquinol methylase
MEVSEEMNTGNENRSYRERIFSRYQTLTSTGTFALRDYEEWAEKVGKRNFLKFLPKDKNSRILDVGCGIGKFLYFLEKFGYLNTVGVDISEENVKIANKFGIRNVVKNDIFDFLRKAPSLSYEMVYCQDVIEHFSKNEIVKLLNLIYKVLALGGWPYLSPPMLGDLWEE